MLYGATPGRSGSGLNVYTLYIEDDRYSVPTLDILTAADDAEALRLAAERQSSSPHYRAIEIRLDDRFVARTPMAGR